MKHWPARSQGMASIGLADRQLPCKRASLLRTRQHSPLIVAHAQSAQTCRSKWHVTPHSCACVWFGTTCLSSHAHRPLKRLLHSGVLALCAVLAKPGATCVSTMR